MLLVITCAVSLKILKTSGVTRLLTNWAKYLSPTPDLVSFELIFFSSVAEVTLFLKENPQNHKERYSKFSSTDCEKERKMTKDTKRQNNYNNDNI